MTKDDRTDIEKFFNIPENLGHDERLKLISAKFEELEAGSIAAENEFLAHAATAQGIRLSNAIIMLSIAQDDDATETRLMRYAEHMGISIDELKQRMSAKFNSL